jgi:DNA-binding transcriptional MerR regulator
VKPHTSGVSTRMSIGEFARQSRLSPKALRLYDELGLLPPAWVDESSGYRFYDPAQLEQARLVAMLRQLHLPLAEIKAMLALEPPVAAQRIARHWSEVEADHTVQRRLAQYLVDSLNGKGSIMYEVTTRDMPARSLLCLKRSVDGRAGAWAFGKEFVALLRERQLPRVAGVPGAVFCIYWGEVSEDSDGPLEWCRPVPPEEAQALAAALPQLHLRDEPAHREAFIDLGPGGREISPAQWQLVAESLRTWAEQEGPRPSELGARITYHAKPEAPAPDCDFAVPFSEWPV